ncbi:glycosyltransferase family 2 protein [Streptomyces antimicrobicus]|uniref:Glycosyltransferase family 2 protein n=1 Tax=Streptomyces antimicrobicus TaxID=2883108 RepID=A0ABS8B2B5_9ACTN|nr:glycosyltransferase family 2 protein [Streptomyces antimicrobicus]MCB5178741.1 glycosyltransferase family 2 protein [Streptomyces antimicrobicus]
MSATRTTRLGQVALSVVVPAYGDGGPQPERLGPALGMLREHLDERFGTGPGDWEVIVVADGPADAPADPTAADAPGAGTADPADAPGAGTADPADAPAAGSADPADPPAADAPEAADPTDPADPTAADVVLAAAAEDPRIRLIRGPREHPGGRGSALRLGVAASAGARVLLTDAALASPVEELERLEKALAEHDGALAAIGSPRTGTGAGPGGRLPGGPRLFDGDRARAAFGASRLDDRAVEDEVLRYFRTRGWPVAEVPPSRPAHDDRPDGDDSLAPHQHQHPHQRQHQHSASQAPAAADPAGARAPGAPRLRLRLRLRLRPGLRRLGGSRLAVPGLFLLVAFLFYARLWADLDGAYLADAMQDQNQWEWFFAVTADNVAHLRNPLFTEFQGMPDGVNLMGNTVMLGLSVPLAPVTLAFGPTVTLALVFTCGVAATASAWYWLIRRWLDVGRPAAVAGAALATFAPPMVSHAAAHPNFVVLFVLPLIVDRALRLCAGRNVVRDGIVLGLLATYQIYLGEEALLLAALGMLVFALGYALFDRRRARVAAKPLLRGMLVAAAVSVPLVAFPLWWQFAGPQSYHSVPHPQGAANSPRALIEYAGHSLFGDKDTAARLSMNHTEQNGFYGWPLLAFGTAVAVWLWRRTAVRALAVTGAGMLLLSLGPAVPVPGTGLVVPGPWRLLTQFPLFEFVIEGRVAMVCAPVLGMLLALALDRILASGAGQRRTLGLLAVAAALIPVLPVPVPLAVRDREPVPEFITSGAWKPYVQEGEALVAVPLPDAGVADALHWQVRADFGFRLAGGYFMGPWGPERIGTFGATPRHLSNLLREVRYGADPPPLGPEWQEQARRDLAYWKAGAVVLPDQDRSEELRVLLTGLLGAEPERVRDVWVWRVGPGGRPAA